MAALAEEMGTPLLPWQRLVADVGLEVMDDGTPAYREVIVTVPRQSGKSTLYAVWMYHRANLWGEPQRIAYTAQTGWDARRKVIDDYAPALMASPLKVTVDRVLRGAGNEAILFKNGSRIDVLASSESAGHGRTIDLAVLDEVFADSDSRREQALVPAMATRREAQMLLTSTAGTDDSVYLRRKVDAGRDAVARGADRGIAYFEWAADPDADPDDRDVWEEVMPALGLTISHDAVEHARASMSRDEFRRAYLNVWTASEDAVIPGPVWLGNVKSGVSVGEPPVFGVDISPNRVAAAIVAADADGNVEVVDARSGTPVSWVRGRVRDLVEKWGGRVVLDTMGPAGGLADDLGREGIDVTAYSTADMKFACARFYDLVADRMLRVAPSDRLDEAVAGAVQRPVGDAWLWGRTRTDVDLTPLVAATVAVDAAMRPAIVDDSPPTITFA